MSAFRRLERFGPALAFAVAAALLLVGLGRHGIWDPTELSFADTVQSARGFEGRPPLHGVLVRLGFAAFGVRDWAGRVFVAGAALLVVLSAMGIARRHFDGRTASYAAIAAVASPLVLLNARWMVGDGPALGASSLFGLCIFTAAFDRTSAGGAGRSGRTQVLALILGLVLAVVATLVRGALLTVLPPLLAVAAVTLNEPNASSGARVLRLVVTSLGLGLLATLAFLVTRDAAAYSVLLGGIPGGEAPPSFERFLQIALHTLAPWSPIFVLSAARTLIADDDEGPLGDERHRVRLALVLWAVFSFGAATLFASRYGTSSFLGVVPVAILAAITFREAEIGRPVELAGVIVVGMILALVLRDYALYPASPLAAVPATAPVLAPGFQPRNQWIALFLLFAACFALGAASRTADGWPPLAEQLEAARARLKAFAERSSLLVRIALAALALGELALIVVALLGPNLGLTSIAVRVSRALAVALPVLPVVIALGGLLALRAFSRLGGARMLPTVIVGALFGAYTQGPFLVALSGELSPREVYETYNTLRAPSDELVEFDLPSRASRYYVDSRVRSVETQEALLAHLQGSGRRWAMFRRNILPDFDRRYRAALGRHLILADGDNTEVVLATNSPVPNHPDENPIVRATAGEREPQHPVGIRFQDVELVGYDLELPNGDSVGAGQLFRITWYWKVLRTPTTDWRIFLHVDGAGQRLNGDHDPIEGLLPTRQWTVGDTLRDQQELTVPPSYPAADYTFFVGFYHGDARMPIVSGNHTPDNRAIAGTLRVR